MISQVTKIAEYLLEKETITNADVTRLIGPRPFGGGNEYSAYVNAGMNGGQYDDMEGNKKKSDDNNDNDDDIKPEPVLAPV
jgi:hypothetical protein